MSASRARRRLTPPGDPWRTEALGPDDEFAFPSIGFTCRVEELYQDLAPPGI